MECISLGALYHVKGTSVFRTRADFSDKILGETSIIIAGFCHVPSIVYDQYLYHGLAYCPKTSFSDSLQGNSRLDNLKY